MSIIGIIAIIIMLNIAPRTTLVFVAAVGFLGYQLLNMAGGIS